MIKGEVIKELRQAKKLSLRELAELTGISASYLSKVEAGERKGPSYAIVLQIANALGVTANVIMDEEVLTNGIRTEVLIEDNAITTTDINILLSKINIARSGDLLAIQDAINYMFELIRK